MLLPHFTGNSLTNFPVIEESIFYIIIGEMGPDFSPKMSVKSLTPQQIVRIHQLFRQAKFDDPTGDVGLMIPSLLVPLTLMYVSKM